MLFRIAQAANRRRVHLNDPAVQGKHHNEIFEAVEEFLEIPAGVFERLCRRHAFRDIDIDDLHRGPAVVMRLAHVALEMPNAAIGPNEAVDRGLRRVVALRHTLKRCQRGLAILWMNKPFCSLLSAQADQVLDPAVRHLGERRIHIHHPVVLE